MRRNATRHKIKGLLFHFAFVLINSNRRVKGDFNFTKHISFSVSATSWLTTITLISGMYAFCTILKVSFAFHICMNLKS